MATPKSNEMRDEDIKKIQEIVKQHYHDILSGNMVLGRFKKIIPILQRYAIAVAEPQGLAASNKATLENEQQRLKELRKHGFPVIETYGNVFEVQPGQYAMIMDWIPNACLIDVKKPLEVAYALPGLLLGYKVDMSKEATKNTSFYKASFYLDLQKARFEKLSERAQLLKEQFAVLLNRFMETNLFVDNLQILVGVNGQCTIIDPRNLVKPAPNAPDKYVDALDNERKLPDGCDQSVSDSLSMLENCIRWFDDVTQAKSLEDISDHIINNLSKVDQPSQVAIGKPRQR